MTYQITTTGDEALIPFNAYYKPDGTFFDQSENDELNEHQSDAPHIAFGLRLMDGRTQRSIADEMIEMNTRTGKSKMKTGTATMNRVVNSVGRIGDANGDNGMELDGRPVTKMNAKVYDVLKAGCINLLSAKIAEINGDDDTNTEEDDADTVEG